MPRCVERTLGSEAIAYIRESLSQGKTLATHLFQDLDIDAGTVVTCVSEDVTEEWLTMFEDGGVVTPDDKAQDIVVPGGRLEPIPNTDPWLASVVKDFVRRGERRVCIFENEAASASYPWLQAAKSRVMTYEEEVYHLVLSGNAADSEITEAIREAGSIAPPTIGALTPWLGNSVPSDPIGELAAGDLAAMARMAQAIMVRAYDGESYLIWRRPA